MHKLTVRSLRTKTERIRLTHSRWLCLISMPEIASSTQLTEAPFVVRTKLLLLGNSWLIGFGGMPVNTLSVLLMAHTIFLEELANGNLVLDIHVEILTILALATHLLQPVDANLLFDFCVVGSRCDRRDVRL